MKLSEKQAYLLIQVLQDTLSKVVIGYLSTSFDFRQNLLREIFNQQSTELIELDKTLTKEK